MAPPADGLTCNLLEPIFIRNEVYKDPYYERYLVPGKINYSEIFGNYAKAKKTREHNFERFVSRIKSLPMDENGIINLSMSSYGNVTTRMWLYAKALREAYSPITGLKVSSSLVQYVPHRKGHLSGLDYILPRDSYTNLYLFVTVDGQAQEKVELMKMKAMIRVEDAAQKLREKILGLHKEGFKTARELELVRLVFGTNPTLEELIYVIGQARTHERFEAVNISFSKEALKKATLNLEAV